MTGRKTENVTRVDIRIPNDLYQQISDLAVSQFHAKIHHRSNKPEVTSTILELLKIGIAHLESTLPVTQDVTRETVTDKLQQQIAQLDSRLLTVENKLSGVTVPMAESNSRVPNLRKPYGSLVYPLGQRGRSSKPTSGTVREQPTKYEPHEEKVLTDMELSNVLTCIIHEEKNKIQKIRK